MGIRLSQRVGKKIQNTQKMIKKEKCWHFHCHSIQFVKENYFEGLFGYKYSKCMCSLNSM